jgi:NTE family protein
LDFLTLRLPASGPWLEPVPIHPALTIADEVAAAEARRELLRALLREFFDVDDPAVIDGIAGELEFIALKSGEVLFRRGERTDDVYFVVSGRLNAVVERADGRHQVLGEIARGETVGELALVTHEPRSATVLAGRESLVARMSRRSFEGILAGRPQLGLAMMRTVVERFRRAERARQPPRIPTNVCFLPITDGVDAEDLARRCAALRAPYGGAGRVVVRGEMEERFSAAERAEAASRHGAVARWLGAAEAESASLFLVADREPTAWTERCIQQADEILLLARADASPAISQVEARLLDEERPEPVATQTLVLLHPAGQRSPTGTARWLDRRRVARHFHIRPALPRDLKRLVRLLAGRGVGLVLSGGGARGFAHIGVMNALAELGIEPDIVGGTSIGSVMGAWRAMDVRGEALVAAGHRAFVASGGPTSDVNFLPLISLIAGRKTRAITEAAVRSVAGAEIDIEDTWTTYYCIAGNYSTSTEAVLTRGPLAKSVLASYAIPGALPPIVLGGQFYVDGGTVNNLPVDVMERLGAGRIVAVDLLAELVRQAAFDWVPGTLAMLADRLRPRHRRRYDLPSLPEMLLDATFLQAVGRQKLMRERADLCIRPTVGEVGLLDWKKYDQVVRSGYASAREQLAAADPAVVEACR